jgi:hypothetical protein
MMTRSTRRFTRKWPQTHPNQRISPHKMGPDMDSRSYLLSKRSFIATGSIPIMAKGAELAQGQKEVQDAGLVRSESRRKTRAKLRCNICNSLEHKAPQCPSCQ